MGLFENLKNNVKISGTKVNDKQGTYWQRIDKIELAKSRKDVEYVKVSKTTVKVIEGETKVGEETTEALFRDDYEFLEKDLKMMAMAAYDLTVEEANALSGANLKSMLIGNKEIEGDVVEVSVKEVLKKDGVSTHAKVRWNHSVTPGQLATLPKDVLVRYFPAGVRV